jgi:hypothetical protein
MRIGFLFALVGVLGGVANLTFGYGQFSESSIFITVGLAYFLFGWKQGGRLRLHRSSE